MGGSINKTENKYEDHRVIHKTRQIVCGDINNVTNTQSLNIQHHHGDVHVTNITTEEGRTKNLINSDADVFVETSLYRQALDKLTGPGSVLLVTGPTKCGKSCLGHALLRHFTEDGYTPLVVNSMKAMSHIAKDKKYAILIDIEGFDEKFVESEVRRLCKMAQVRNSLIVFALHESCLSQEGDGDEARAHCAFQILKISRSSKYCEKEKAEMLRKHLGREKRVDEGFLQVVVSTETCGYLFPLRCMQYAEVVDDDDCSYDPILLFTHLEDIIQCTRLQPVTVIEINTDYVSPVPDPYDKLWYGSAIEDCTQENLRFFMYCKNLQKLDLDEPVSGETPLLKACRTSDTETVKELLKSKKEKPNYQTHECITPLHLACLAGSEAIVDLLLESGAKADAVDSHGLTPLHCACRQGNPAVVESIIKAFNVPAPPDADRMVLQCRSGHQELVKALRACNMASSSTSLQVCTTCLAQCRPALDNVRRHNHNINMRIMQKYRVEQPTALHIACMFSHLEAVEKLLENGACTELRFSVHDLQRSPFYLCSTPLVLACALGLTDVVRLLLKHKACADPLHDVTALHVASYYGRSDVVQMLLDNGADAEVTDIDGNLPLHQAVLCSPYYEPVDLPNLSHDKNHFKVCQLLLNKRREAVNAMNKAKRCPLYEACVRKDMDTVRLLVEHGADVNQAADGVAALHIACNKGHTELVQLLIDLGADVDKQGTSSGNISVWSPLHIACARCHADIVELLLKNNCKVDFVSERGETLLHQIGTRLEDYIGDIEKRERLRRGSDSYANAQTIAKLLLDTGNIDVNSSASFTGTPLQHFCDLGHLGIVRMLLKHEALVNPSQPHEEYYQQIESPLQLAVKFSIESAAQNRDEWREEAEEIIHLLLQHDASVATLFDQGWRCPDSTGLKGVNQLVLRYLSNGSNAATILCRMFERGITTPDSEDNMYRVQAGEHILKKETALHLACMLCREDVVKTLLDKGADLSARDGNHMTPLMALCVYSKFLKSYNYNSRPVEQSLSILHILAERGEDMYSEDTKGRLPVQELSHNLQQLLDAKVVSVHGTDRQGRTLLHQLCAKSLQVPDVIGDPYGAFGLFRTQVSSVTVLINAGANVNARDFNGDTPLHLACMQGHVAAVQHLLSHKDLELKANNEGKTPLDLATDLEDVSLRTRLLQMLQSLKNAPEELPAADVKSVPINSQTPDCVEANSQGEEPAACAVSQDVPEISSEVSPSEDVQGEGLSQTASLTSQACEKTTQTRQDLLASAGHVTLQPDQGVANFQLQSVESQDATHSSHNKPGQVDQWSLQLLDDMLTSGVPVDSLVDGEGLSPLHYACKEGDLHLAERLLSAGVDVNKTDVTGRTAVHFASERGDVMMLDLLLHHGCDVRVKDKQGLSAFHDACYHGHANAASILLSKGAEVKEVDVLGNTALHLACGQGHTEVAVTLLQGGARVMTQNNQGQTAMSLAASSGNELLVKVVKRHIVEYGQGQGRLAEKEKSQAERDRLWKMMAILAPSVIMAFIAAVFHFLRS